MFKTFMHYRRIDRNGYPSTKGGFTVAIQRQDETITVAIAECSKEDNFDRKRGRMIAEGRLLKMSPKNIRILSLPNPTDNVKSFVNGQDFIQEKVQKLLAS